MITRKAGPALAAGCCMALKPAEATPLTALALAALAEQAAVPAGVLNIVTAKSGAEVGREFCENPIVRKLSFTGSTATGENSSETMRRYRKARLYGTGRQCPVYRLCRRGA